MRLNIKGGIHKFRGELMTASEEVFWTERRPLPEPRADGGTAVIGDKIYYVGGYHPSGSDSKNDVFVYDVEGDSWSEGKKIPTRFSSHITTCSCEGKIYCFGGSDGESLSRETWVYETSKDEWSRGKDLPFKAGLKGAAAIEHGGQIYLVGGEGEGGAVRDLIVYNPRKDSYDRSRNKMNTPRKWFNLSKVGGTLYAIGGGNGESPQLKSVEAYDIENDEWSSRAPMPAPRYGLPRENSAIDGEIYVTHGMFRVPSVNLVYRLLMFVGKEITQFFSFYRTCFRYNPKENSWGVLNRANYARDGASQAVVDKKLYVIGGRNTRPTKAGLAYNEMLQV